METLDNVEIQIENLNVNSRQSVTLLKCICCISIVLAACSVNIPKEQYFQFYVDSKIYFKNDTIYFYLTNPLRCPLRYYLSSTDTTLDKRMTDFKLITLQLGKDTLFGIAADSTLLKTTSYRTMLGDVSQKIIKNKISLPFPEGRSYEIIQGYNDSYSHANDNYSRYAIDFGLEVNDTICAADDGFVVGVINDYKLGGDDERLISYANVLTLYHPRSGLFTQYVHLIHNGNLVELGDPIKRGQPIGLSGETGYTDIAHLHFNVLVPVTTPEGLNSVKMTFTEGYEGADLKRNDRVKNRNSNAF
jgi:murein DD-endopeptidase MepM/ murein hydrolase activator NlpD